MQMFYEGINALVRLRTGGAQNINVRYTDKRRDNRTQVAVVNKGARVKGGGKGKGGGGRR